MKKILVDSSVQSTQIGFLEDGELTEYIYESSSEKSIVGNIYVGRVTAVHKGMQACFVDIGEEKNAYMLMEKGKNIQVYSQIAVQVQKDASESKGAGVTDKLSFPGKFLVLIPGDNGNIGVSKKIYGEEERERIRDIAEKTVPEGYGMIIRTEGAKKTFEDFEKETKSLYSLSCQVLQSAEFTKAPALLRSEESTVLKAARDLFGDNVDEIILNNKKEFEIIKEETVFAPERVVYYDSPVPMFENYFAQSQLEKIFNKKVWLKSGGFLIIEQTEACVVIDVNTGKYTGKRDFQETIIKTNLEAAAEIAKQIRLRNLSGMIIIDFIDMKQEENKKILQTALEKAVKRDRIKTTVVGMTQLGLMQLTRKKTSIPVAAKLTTQCKCCRGSGVVQSFEYIAGEIRQKVSSVFSQTVFNRVTILSSKAVLKAFAGYNNCEKEALEQKFGKTIVLKEIETAAFNHYELESEKI